MELQKTLAAQAQMLGNITSWLTEELYNSTNDITDDESTDHIQWEMYVTSLMVFWFGMVTVPSLAALGILGNIVSFWVWQAETSYNATNFLFKCLSVWDTVFLAAVIANSIVVVRSNSTVHSFVFHCGNLAQLLSVHVTLLVAICRWVAVTIPLRAQRLLTSCRVYTSCLLLSLWCLLLEGAFVMTTFGFADTIVTARTVKRVVGLALPLLLLLIFNLSLLWRITRRPKELLESSHNTPLSPLRPQRKEEPMKSGHQQINLPDERSGAPCDRAATNSADVTEDSKLQPLQQNRHQDQQHEPQQLQQSQDNVAQGQPQTQKENDNHGCDTAGHYQRHRQQQKLSKDDVHEGHHHHRQQQRPCTTTGRRQQRVTTTVLCISLSCFIAYPLGVSVQASAVESGHDLDIVTYLTFIYVAYICQVINSGINVVFYCIFMSRFRELVKLRTSSCSRVCKQAR